MKSEYGSDGLGIWLWTPEIRRSGVVSVKGEPWETSLAFELRRGDGGSEIRGLDVDSEKTARLDPAGDCRGL